MEAHLNTLNTKAVKVKAVFIILITSDKKIILGQKRTWKTPKFLKCFGGKVRDGEKILDTLSREILEETNLVIDASTLKKVKDVDVKTHFISFYSVENVDPSKIKLDEETEYFRTLDKRQIEEEISYAALGKGGILPNHAEAIKMILPTLV